MPYFDNEEKMCVAGPKKNSLATEHLNYILHAMLTNPKNCKFDDNHALVTINNFPFDLSAIFAAEPKFEFISLSEIYLNAYLQWRIQEERQPIDDMKNYPHLHHAEKAAIYSYTDAGEFEVMNAMLRGQTKSFSRSVFLDSCIAAQALHKQPISSSMTQFKLYRGDKTQNHIQENVITNYGFFSTSMSSSIAKEFTDNHSIMTEIHSNPHCQPACLDVSKLAWKGREKEILFPPNTVFQYKKIKLNKWVARPIYNVNLPEKPYRHGFSAQQLAQIKHDHLQLKVGHSKFKIRVIYNFLLAALKANTHRGYQRFLDTVDNKQKLKCLQDVLDKVIHHYQQQAELSASDILNIIQTIQNSINKNTHLAEQSSWYWSCSAGKTHQVLTEALRMAEEIQEDIHSLKSTYEDEEKCIPVSDRREAGAKLHSGSIPLWTNNSSEVRANTVFRP